MNRQEAVADGVATFISMMVAITGPLLLSMSSYEAFFLAFLASLYGSFALVIAHRAVNASLKHILASDAALLALGILAFLLQNPLGPWVAIPYAILIGLPFMTCPLAGPRPPPRARRLDVRLLSLATRYGGVLTKAIVMRELGLSLEEAEALLARFCQHGEAKQVVKGKVVLYVFPSAQASLSRVELKVVEALVDNPGGMSREEFVGTTGLAPDELDSALLELSLRGVVRFLPSSSDYKLACLMPPKRPKPRRKGARKARRRSGPRYTTRVR